MFSKPPNLLPMEQKQNISLPENLTIEQQQHQHYALKWSEFQSSILNCFQRLRDEEDFVDVTLTCDEKSFTAHRVVLSACSPYFRKLLKSNPCKHPIVILKDVRSENLECILSFMYNGEVNLRHDQLPEFLKTANLLQIRGLTDVSESLNSSGFISLATNKRSFDRDASKEDPAEKCSFIPKYKPTSERPYISTLEANYSNNNNNNLPPMKETKTSTTASLQWDDVDIIRNLKNRSTPPPQKRIKSADLFRAQHGINSERPLSERDFPVIGQHSLSRDQKIISSDCEQIAAINESNIESLVERRQTLQNQRTGTESMDDGSLEHKSNISDEDTLEHIDGQQVNNDSLHHPRSTIHNAFLGVPKGAEHQSIINLGDFEYPEKISTNLSDKAVSPKTSQHYSAILCNNLWNAKYEELPQKENGLSCSSIAHNNLSIDSYVAQSTALSLMVKTARLKNKPTIYQNMIIKEEHQSSQTEHNERLYKHEQHQCQNRFVKQLPIYEYLYGLEKTAMIHQCILDTNLTKRDDVVMSDIPLTPISGLDDEDNTSNINSSYVLPCPLCEVPLEQKSFRQHLDGHYPRDSPVCPVLECGRRFAHPNSVRNHMRIKHTHQWAKMKVMRSSAAPLSSGLDLKTKCETTIDTLNKCLFTSVVFCLYNTLNTKTKMAEF
ncbi:PREDICTED: uncharacterized protein LOC108359747 [Rhagoletis zephyria]|uniref:uncharacterized protein LOC108359747 n=1 Tax=Rhagoletis zephyria TaxID=28612 RepID=UPI0008114933|nr:PREDICTED: uncharacterized protein LOC108359747 [Rhagoletis zephyria]